MTGHECFVCGNAVLDYEPQMCCDGHMCGCLGLPIEPPLCSVTCTEKLYGVSQEHLPDEQQDIKEWSEFIDNLSDTEAKIIFGEDNQ